MSDGGEAVGEDPHFHGAVSAAREDVVGGPHFDLHDAGAQVPEERLASVLVWEGVERTLRGHAPDLQSREGDEEKHQEQHSDAWNASGFNLQDTSVSNNKSVGE